MFFFALVALVLMVVLLGRYIIVFIVRLAVCFRGLLSVGCDRYDRNRSLVENLVYSVMIIALALWR